MKVNSHALLFRDFNTGWYKKWAKELKQDSNHLEGHHLRANKFWQNAAICQALFERKQLKVGNRGIGFGVGQERLPALFAKYGVYVTATDQDFNTLKSKHWSDQELATGAKSLNILGIADKDSFNKHVEYKTLDMTKIPSSLQDKYNFLWSNCSLGHLGSIPKGLKFIEDSLKCLKPGGAAVHTTEVNVLSNEKTVTDGDTVIFRLRDLYEQAVKLTKQGYIISPLKFDLGYSQDDYRISLQPQFGNNYSKIQVGGHICTQVIIIIRRPKRAAAKQVMQKLRLWQLEYSYRRAISNMEKFKKRNQNVKQLQEGKRLDLGLISLSPIKTVWPVNIKAGQTKRVFIEFKNDSSISLYSAYGHLKDTHPVLLGTTGPENRSSKFANQYWVAGTKNRASSDFQFKKGKVHEPVDHVPPQQPFAFKVMLSATNVPKGQYSEKFAVLQEGIRWLDGTGVELSIKVS